MAKLQVIELTQSEWSTAKAGLTGSPVIPLEINTLYVIPDFAPAPTGSTPVVGISPVGATGISVFLSSNSGLVAYPFSVPQAAILQMVETSQQASTISDLTPGGGL